MLKSRLFLSTALIAGLGFECFASSSNSVQTVAKVASSVEKRAAADGNRPPRGNSREWMENLKKTDPARYAQMTNRFAQWRQRRADQTRAKTEFLSSFDTSHMSESALKTHRELQTMIARREELEQQLHQEDLSDDRRRQLFEQMRETDLTVRKLNSEERKNLIEETAKKFGLKEQAVKDISSEIQKIVEMTDGAGRVSLPLAGEQRGR